MHIYREDIFLIMKKPSFPVTNIGSVSLLMTFIVLCLVTFSTLSLSGSVSEYHYSQKLAKHNQDYYEASNTALRTLQEIDTILHDAYTENRDSYYSSADRELARLESVTADFSKEIPTVAYEVPVTSKQSLKVVLSLNKPGQMRQGYYKITTWKEIASSEWNGDDSLNLFKP